MSWSQGVKAVKAQRRGDTNSDRDHNLLAVVFRLLGSNDFRMPIGSCRMSRYRGTSGQMDQTAGQPRVVAGFACQDPQILVESVPTVKFLPNLKPLIRFSI